MTSETSATVQTWREGRVGIVEMNKPPSNFFDEHTLRTVAESLESFATDGETRAVVLCSNGKHFCAGADLVSGRNVTDIRLAAETLYGYALRIFAQPLPLVAAVQGAAVGGGLGLSLTADFRVCDTTARFTANFARLGYHPGFGITVSLPRVVGAQRALELMLSARNVHADEALAIGLCDRLAEEGGARAGAIELATQLTESGPLAVRAIRATARAEFLAALEAAIAHEIDEQSWLMKTADWREGVRASRDRRTPDFKGE